MSEQRVAEELRLQFISAELDIAASLCEIALTSKIVERVERSTANALRAYQEALHQLGEARVLEPGPEIARKMQRVEGLLSQLDADGSSEG